MKSHYPLTFGELRSWATENGVDVAEARVRFAQYAILRAIASSRALSSALVFKGGNALDFVWMPNRSTGDLDFSLDVVALDQQPTPEGLRARQDYDVLRATTRDIFIPFDEALKVLYQLVDSLDIPAGLA